MAYALPLFSWARGTKVRASRKLFPTLFLSTFDPTMLKSDGGGGYQCIITRSCFIP
jgi:hypothetical protein